METVYKITDKNSKTRPGCSNETQWGENVTHKTAGGEMCGPGILHAYCDPLVAVILNPAHAAYDANTMLLWECQANVTIRNADKLGCIEITTVRQIPIPQITTTQKIAFAILVAQEVYKHEKFNKWATDWLSGKDRSEKAAWAAARSAWAAAAEAAEAAAAWAAEAAEARSAWAAVAAARKEGQKLDLSAIARKALEY